MENQIFGQGLGLTTDFEWNLQEESKVTQWV